MLQQHRAHVTVFVISCIATLALLRGVFAWWTTPQHITVVCDEQLNPKISEQLTQWCYEHADVLDDPQQLVHAFSWARSCDVRFVSPKHAIVSIAAHTPCTVINETLVLLRHGAVVDKDLYGNQALPEAIVTVAHDALQDKQNLRILAQSVSCMEPTLFHSYYFSWDNATHCMITEKKSGSVVVADNVTMQDSTKISNGLALVAHDHIADIRFDKQIVLRQNTPKLMLGVNDGA